ncbi:MAG: hypothetical protein PHF35_03115 [Candidatus Moranbacteria bacterium]|nr:hypothetical protein [Candidatus Moranbacteria bacterium]
MECNGWLRNLPPDKIIRAIICKFNKDVSVYVPGMIHMIDEEKLLSGLKSRNLSHEIFTGTVSELIKKIKELREK